MTAARPRVSIMFTGLIVTTTPVHSLRGQAGGAILKLVAPAPEVLAPERLPLGGSLAVNGCCLTLAGIEREQGKKLWVFQLAPETLARTALRRLRPGVSVNLEPALRAGDALGGHWVQGHVDATGIIVDLKRLRPGHQSRPSGAPDHSWLRLEIPAELLPLVAEKGSLAVDGISLTVARISGNIAEFTIIPHTLRQTSLGQLQAGNLVNLEADLIARYLARQLTMQTRSGRTKKSSLHPAELRRQGF